MLSVALGFVFDYTRWRLGVNTSGESDEYGRLAQTTFFIGPLFCALTAEVA